MMRRRSRRQRRRRAEGQKRKSGGREREEGREVGQGGDEGVKLPGRLSLRHPYPSPSAPSPRESAC